MKTLWASPFAERSADTPKRASSRGCLGGRAGPSSWARRGSARATNGAISRSYARPSPRSPAAVSVIDRSSIAALPSSSGCASGTGSIHSRPCDRSGKERRNGEATAIGWMAEQTSWWNPGAVSSALRAPPPTESRATGSRERDRRAEAIRPRANHDRVQRWCRHRGSPTRAPSPRPRQERRRSAVGARRSPRPPRHRGLRAAPRRRDAAGAGAAPRAPRTPCR